MLDFTSALYLGMRHDSRTLGSWPQLTTGVPAGLGVPEQSLTLACKLAQLMQCEAATLAASTLHLCWDLFGMLAPRNLFVLMDAGLYPIARWGVERAAARGVPVRCFSHHDVSAMHQLLQQHATRQKSPVIVTDGFCPDCGRVAPLAEYWRAARARGGYLIVDDTQALGILGHSPRPQTPYGHGGGGALPWANVSGGRILIISSLAKGFGVPLAVLAGSKVEIERFESESETRMHCSPPSLAALQAAAQAVQVNEDCGEQLRSRLAGLVRYFREKLSAAGFKAGGGWFPVQTLSNTTGMDVVLLHRELWQRGISTVLHHGRRNKGARLSFIINVTHIPADLDFAAATLAEAANRPDGGQAHLDFARS